MTYRVQMVEEMADPKTDMGASIGALLPDFMQLFPLTVLHVRFRLTTQTYGRAQANAAKSERNRRYMYSVVLFVGLD